MNLTSMNSRRVNPKRWIVAASLATACALASALPSVQDVETAVKQGQYTQAETMMKEVVDAKPNSARGHYLYAEILAHNARFSQAATEASAAARLDPAIGFTQPEKFRAFQDLLAREQRAETSRTSVPATATTAARTTAPAPARDVEPQRSGVPGWIWLVGLAAIGYALWRGFSRSRAAAGGAVMGAAGPGYGGVPANMPPNGPMGMGPGYAQQPAGYGPAPGGFAPGYGQPMGMNRGGGMLGTGIAAAGGVVAGMAIDRMLHPGQTGGHAAGFGDAASNGDLGQMSTFDQGGTNEPARELEDRSVDFGNGGNDWGGDAGGSIDAGGGSSDGGWD